MLKSAQRIMFVAVCLTIMAAATLHAQVGGAGKAPAAKTQPRIPDNLWVLLGDWEEGSARIKKIHGKHVRRAYDKTFEMEKIAQGEFWYETPDKGRMDVKPVRITKDMLAKRQDPSAQVQRKKNGQPFELKSDDPSRWLCDGEKIYEIDDARKEARMMVLAPEIRGTAIMNSPLPFLFGLPRDESLRRFNLEIVHDYRPKYPVVRLHATPRLRGDAKNWSEAEVLLNTDTFLPQAVKLINPAGTKDTRYTFQDMEVNKNGFLGGLIGSDPWDPKLGRDYKVQVIKPEDVAQRAPAAAGPRIPNVEGEPHDVATNMLIQAGFARDNISKLRGIPAPNAAKTYTVNTQKPAPGQTLPPGQKIVLMIYDKPANGAGAGIGQGNGNRVAGRQ